MIDSSKCTGCGLCAEMCPAGAVSMREDERTGFFYPRISMQLCTACGGCEYVCPQERSVFEKGQMLPLKAYAAIAVSKGDHIRKNSTSGGIFPLLAEYVARQGGLVCGAAYDEHLDVVHKAAADLEGIRCFRRSKYLQSRLWPVFDEIKKAADRGQKVLVSGTPCQIDAVCTFAGLAGWKEQLLTVDLLCRGVPSPKAFHSYLSELEEEHEKKIIQVDFKVKDKGWHRLGTRYTFADGSCCIEDKTENDFLRSFVEGDYCVRESCFSCSYKSLSRVSDITLGDYWGLEDKEMDDDFGTSAVLVNTEKGMELFAHIMPGLRLKETDVWDIKKGNRLAFMDLRENSRQREMFWDLLEKEGCRRAGRLVRQV